MHLVNDIVPPDYYVAKYNAYLILFEYLAMRMNKNQHNIGSASQETIQPDFCRQVVRGLVIFALADS